MEEEEVCIGPTKKEGRKMCFNQKLSLINKRYDYSSMLLSYVWKMKEGTVTCHKLKWQIIKESRNIKMSRYKCGLCQEGKKYPSCSSRIAINCQTGKIN